MKLFAIFISLVASANAATWYVDGTATGANNGTSWANAWPTIAAMTTGRGVITSGDTVYISGGPSGTSQTYDATSDAGFPGQWNNMKNGVTYQIGQDSAHNGQAIFDATGGGTWLQHDHTGVTLSGKVGDGSDGLRHFYLKDHTTSAGPGNCSNTVNFTIEYVDFGHQSCNAGSSALDFNPGTNIEVRYCALYADGATTNALTGGSFSGTGYASSRFHHNAFTAIRSDGTLSTTGYGGDFCNWHGSGISLYNNTFVSVTSPLYSGGQHQDGYQGSGGQYLEVYDNRFTDISNYCVFPELPSVGNTYNHVRIYNNICVITYANNTQAIAIGVRSDQGKTFSDTVVANNICDGYQSPITMRNPITGVTDPTAWTTTYCYNNSTVNSGANIIDVAITSAANVSVTSGNAPSYFTSWAASTSTNNYHLLAAATPLIGTGTDASTLIGSLDASGTTRTAPWDVGPYAYSGVAPGLGGKVIGGKTIRGGK